MAARNCYVVLGIPRGESPAGIRSAYHELARRMHPDLAGPSGAARFQEINQAYAILSDPTRRRDHDRQCDESARGAPAEGPPGPEPVSLFSRPEQTKPSFDALLERYLRNFMDTWTPKAERAESLTLDVTLSPLQAYCGTTITVGVPVFGACPDCGGRGEVVPFRCIACAGSGLFEEERRLLMRIPPRAQAGAVLEAPLELFGIRNLYLRVHVSISDEICEVA